MNRTIILLLSMLLASKHGCGSAATGQDGDGAADERPLPCPLKCQNGGVCRHGKADGSKLHPVHTMYSPADLPFLETSHAEAHDKAHCVCPAGYVGPTCGVALETCGKNEHHCFHGATCRMGLSDLGKEFFYCDCSTAGRDRPQSFAGHMCQYASTVFCGSGKEDEDFIRTRHSFCTNGGKCLDAGDDETHFGCECPEEWEGQHCEFKKGEDPKSFQTQTQATDVDAKDGRSKGGFVFLLIVVTVSITGVALSLFGKLPGDKRKTHVFSSEVAGSADPDGGLISSRGDDEKTKDRRKTRDFSSEVAGSVDPDGGLKSSRGDDEKTNNAYAPSTENGEVV